MPAIDPVEVAHALMLDAARNVTKRQIRNAIGDREGSADLAAGELDDLVHTIGHLIYTADIDIDVDARRA